MNFFKAIRQAIFSMASGFFATFLVLAALLLAYHFEQRKTLTWNGIPIIEELTDTYLEGWEAIQPKKTKTRIARTPAPKSDGAITFKHSWKRKAIEKKLRKNGFNKAQLKKADVYLDYIEQNMKWACEDMYFHDVLASVKLAQALLESNAGNSRLAKQTNNHFGIKARLKSAARKKIKSKQINAIQNSDFQFTAPAIDVFQMYDDNPYDRFEVYPSIANSYQRHTALLTRDCKFSRIGCYSWIWKTFDTYQTYDISEYVAATSKRTGLQPKDFFGGRTELPYYAAAAVGLKISGYATANHYHHTLSYIIETYELWRLDAAIWGLKAR